MGIKYLNLSSSDNFDKKDEKSAAKFHSIKTVHFKVVAQSIAFRVVSIYWQGVAPFPWYLNAKRPTPHWKHVAARCPVSACWPSCWLWDKRHPVGYRVIWFGIPDNSSHGRMPCVSPARYWEALLDVVMIGTYALMHCTDCTSCCKICDQTMRQIVGVQMWTCQLWGSRVMCWQVCIINCQHQRLSVQP